MLCLHFTPQVLVYFVVFTANETLKLCVCIQIKVMLADVSVDPVTL